jgi:uroporphyrinogen decarboxylase
MLTNIQDRYYKAFTYQACDRLPDIEFGYWPQTLRRWLKEGMTLELTPEERTQCFPAKVDRFLGLDAPNHASINPRVHMNPLFPDKEIERCADGSVIFQDGYGCTAKRYLSDSDDSSIPHYIKFAVETPEDWAGVKERFRFDDPVRAIPDPEIAELRAAMAAGKAITVSLCGFYGQLRYWMGMENLSLAFYDHPEMVHDMAMHWAELCARQLERLPADIRIDIVNWWEDMACKNGPLCSPSVFRDFFQLAYRRVMQAAKKRGCSLGMVDCDGNPHDIVANWMAEGVNIMFPLEVAAGADPYAWRREFGKELRLRGGIAKEPLVRGGSAIDQELDRIRPLLEQGGYIPHLDHLVPPDIPYRNYCEYLEKKRKLIGK